MLTHTVAVVAAGVGSDVDEVAIMGFGLNVADVSVQLAPWLRTTTVLEHILFTCKDEGNVTSSLSSDAGQES